ncbi:ABC transporter permease [Planomonospora alba]|uniref:Transport permease protein n=2 Tax=Planomonospora alba TaxID=161354 RepID=A0ABP6MIL3_9ACTN
MLFLGHELGILRRNPVWPLFGIMQPILYLLLFAPLLTSITPNGTLEEALVMFTPAALVMIALFGTMFSGFGMINETRNGVLERLAVSQAWRPAIVLGRVAKDVIMLVLQSLIILGVAALMGLRVGLPAVGLVLLLMAAAGLFAANLSYGLALAVRDENGMSQIVQFFLVPLMLLSGLMLPISVAPDWMQAVARFNPLYYAVEAGRALFAGDFSDGTVPVAFGLFLALSVLTLTWSLRSLRKLAG